VGAADDDIVQAPNLGVDRVGDGANDGEGQQEGYR